MMRLMAFVPKIIILTITYMKYIYMHVLCTLNTYVF